MSPMPGSLARKHQDEFQGLEWRYLERLYHTELITIRGTSGSPQRRSAPTASASSPPATRPPGLGRQDRRELLTLKGHTSRQFGVVQPRRHAHRHRQLGQDAKVWDARTGRSSRSRGTRASSRRRSAPTASGSSPRCRTRRRSLGRPERCRGLTLKGHTGRRLGVVQPRRQAPRHRERDETVKVWDAATGRSAHAQGAHRRVNRRRSAPTARARLRE